jgi:acetyl esterase/lipase
MPVGYATVVLLVAGCVAAALSPPRHPPPLARAAWWAGFLVAEIPAVVAVTLVVVSALALAGGAAGDPVGLTALALAAATVAGLGLLAWRGLLAGPAVDAALDAAGFPPAAAPAGRRNLARALLSPWPRRPRGVTRVVGLRYGDAGTRNLLDLYHRRDRPAGAPVLIHLHAGAFRGGRRSREALPLLYRLAGLGWVCVSATYRVTPPARFPDHLVDVKKVLAWVREHAAWYGGDPAVVYLAGSSAGAHLAAMAALTAGEPGLQPGFEAVDTSVSGVVCLYGFYGAADPAAPLPSSPEDHLRPDRPPFLLVHGDLDSLVPVGGARRFAARLRATSDRPVAYAELPGAQHTFDLVASPRFEAVVDGVERFAAWTRPHVPRWTTPD